MIELLILASDTSQYRLKKIKVTVQKDTKYHNSFHQRMESGAKVYKWPKLSPFNKNIKQTINVSHMCYVKKIKSKLIPF